jgi:hypothetical protein
MTPAATPAGSSKRHRNPDGVTPRAAAELVRKRRGAARFAGSIPVHDAALREIVRRHLEIDPVPRENLDPVTAQASGDVRQDRLAVLEFDREGRAREDLLDGTE